MMARTSREGRPTVVTLERSDHHDSPGRGHHNPPAPAHRQGAIFAQTNPHGNLRFGINLGIILQTVRPSQHDGPLNVCLDLAFSNPLADACQERALARISNLTAAPDYLDFLGTLDCRDFHQQLRRIFDASCGKGRL